MVKWVKNGQMGKKMVKWVKNGQMGINGKNGKNGNNGLKGWRNYILYYHYKLGWVNLGCDNCSNKVSTWIS